MSEIPIQMEKTILLRKLVIVLTLALFVKCSSAQFNTIMTDTEDNQKYIIGYTTLEAFQNEEFKTWYEAEYNAYNEDKVSLSELKQSINDYEILIVMGTWCSDSRREVPRFIKILNSAEYQMNNLTIINVDRNKIGLDDEVEELNIEFVPTFILYKNSMEIGRIIETPWETLEIDLVAIINRLN